MEHILHMVAVPGLQDSEQILEHMAEVAEVSSAETSASQQLARRGMRPSWTLAKFAALPRNLCGTLN